jgi:Trk K+ transport system NAD-binding subunit
MANSTVCICAHDPASRALARASFLSQSWFLVEATPEDLLRTLRAVKLDALVYVGPPDELRKIRALIAAEKVVVPRLVSIVDASRACDILSTT